MEVEPLLGREQQLLREGDREIIERVSEREIEGERERCLEKEGER